MIWMGCCTGHGFLPHSEFVAITRPRRARS